MRAAVVFDFAAPPRYGTFAEPVPGPGEAPVLVAAAALSPLARSQAAGQHYSSGNSLPLVPGNDGVGRWDDGRRVYFMAARAPFGSMAERTVARREDFVNVPEGVDDVTAAAIANPGMSSAAALLFRAKLTAGETVLVHGASCSAGGLAIRLAKYLGAGRVIATGRGADFLESARALGADLCISLSQPEDALLRAMKDAVASGVDIILDYLWGPPAELLLHAFVGSGSPHGEPRVRYVQIGSVAGASITLASEVLRSTGIELIGSGLGSVPRAGLLASIATVFDAVIPAGLKIDAEAVPLAAVEETWNRETKGRRLVLTI